MIPSLRTLTGYYQVAAIFRRDDVEQNSGSTATVIHGQQFPDEMGQMGLWTHHMAA
jgi:hypothetical protein